MYWLGMNKHIKYQCKIHPEFTTDFKEEFLNHITNHSIEVLSVEERTKDMFNETEIIDRSLLLE